MSGSWPVSKYLTVRCTDEDGVVTLTAVGEVDLESAGVLGHAIEQGVGLRPAELVVDIAGVSFLDASGAGVLIDGRRRARDRGIRYRVCGATRVAKRVLDVLGVHTVLAEG
ncbi:STAS domain-containing protein [Micromonospora sp. CPCC 206061]|uniref:STAS domain-containing protein n=1 Tax=Micromonospora sp. CPCC 206061 TaxID=3122410 RepID=UPI002FF1D2B2